MTVAELRKYLDQFEPSAEVFMLASSGYRGSERFSTISTSDWTGKSKQGIALIAEGRELKTPCPALTTAGTKCSNSVRTPGWKACFVHPEPTEVSA